MLKAVLAFIPLLAGYLFVNTLHETRYHSRRQNSQAVYFYAAFAGVLLLGTAAGICWYFHDALMPVFSYLKQWSAQTLPLEETEKDSAIGYWLVVLGLTLAIGYSGGFVFNFIQGVATLLCSKRGRLLEMLVDGSRARGWKLWRYLRPLHFISVIYSYSSHTPLRRAVQRMNADFEEILLRAEDRSMAVMLSMSSGKVYVGLVAGAVDPVDSRDMIRLFPIMSGYRKEETHKVQFTTFYTHIYERMQEKNYLEGLDLEAFEIAFCFRDVQSATLFNFDAYNEFQRLSLQGDNQLKLNL